MVRVGLVGLNQTPLDWKGNLKRIRLAWTQAREQCIHILCFPELAISGYGCEDSFFNPDTHQRAWLLLCELAKECGNECVLLGLPLYIEGNLYNGVAVLNQGEIRGISLKSHLAKDGIHYEPRWFSSWPLGQKKFFRVGRKDIPIGSLSYLVGNLSFCIEICEDAWVPDKKRPYRLFSQLAWVFNASASHFSLGKAEIRERIVRESSVAFGGTYAYTNMVGCESGRAIYDGELLIGQKGQVVARSDRLYLDEVKLLAHDTDDVPIFSGTVDVVVKAGHREHAAFPSTLQRSSRDAGETESEFPKAATLALFDYMRKSHSRGFTLSLSGGVDSSTIAVLISVMSHRLFYELSLEERRRRFSYFPELNVDVQHPKDLTAQLLTTVYQAGQNSGAVTRAAASALAKAIGSKHLELNIDELVQGYQKMIAQAIGQELSWDQHDLALQNIQARVRSPSVWMLANLNGSLLLTTSNRSEVAVGYATMDGDTSGGLAPIAGVEKTFLQRWLCFIEKSPLFQVAPIPELALVNQQEPTAELRPPDRQQKDEHDLMPYPVLDALEELIIAQRKTPCEAFKGLKKRYSKGFSHQNLYSWTKKFCKMFASSQWKRERYAPAFHLDDRNLDPKTWARFPILSGSFEVELEEMDCFFGNEVGNNSASI